MGEETAISWCEHTHNCWWGCEHAEREPGSAEPAPECQNCYAESFDHRLGGEHWGPGAPPRFFGAKYWSKPIAWNAAAEKAGVRARVFCSSMADWAQLHTDPEVAARQRAELHRLWKLIRSTPWLDWLMLTKRIDRAQSLLPWMADVPILDVASHEYEETWERRGYPITDPWPNVWVGTTCGARSSLWRIETLRRVPAAVRFVSCEPLLDHITADEWDEALGPWNLGIGDNLVNWLIVGAESGANRRPAQLDWVRTAREAALRHRVGFHFKQWVEDGSTRTGKVVHLPVLDGRVHDARPNAGIPRLQRDPVDPDHHP